MVVKVTSIIASLLKFLSAVFLDYPYNNRMFHYCRCIDATESNIVFWLLFLAL